MRKRKPPVAHAGRHTLMQKADTRRLSVALGSLSEVGVHQINIAVETEDQNTFRFYLGFFFFNGLERIILHFTERLHQYGNGERKW